MPVLIDGRELVPPEPLELAINALEKLAPGDEVVLLLYCQPFPLYGILGRDGFAWRETLRDDGTREIHIFRADQPPQ